MDHGDPRSTPHDPEASADAPAGGSAPESLDPQSLVDRYGERIYRLAFRMTGQQADAEDVTQNTLIKVLRKAHTFRGDSDPMGWIYRIAMNEARELFRRRSRRPAVSLDNLPIEFDDTSHPIGISDFSAHPQKQMLAAEMDARVREAIDELPDGYREAVVLTDLEGLPYKESAALMELELATFKTRLHRGRLHLRNRLQSLFQDHEGQEAAGETA